MGSRLGAQIQAALDALQVSDGGFVSKTRDVELELEQEVERAMAETQKQVRDKVEAAAGREHSRLVSFEDETAKDLSQDEAAMHAYVSSSGESLGKVSDGVAALGGELDKASLRQMRAQTQLLAVTAFLRKRQQALSARADEHAESAARQLATTKEELEQDVDQKVGGLERSTKAQLTKLQQATEDELQDTRELERRDKQEVAARLAAQERAAARGKAKLLQEARGEWSDLQQLTTKESEAQMDFQHELGAQEKKLAAGEAEVRAHVASEDEAQARRVSGGLETVQNLLGDVQYVKRDARAKLMGALQTFHTELAEVRSMEERNATRLEAQLQHAEQEAARVADSLQQGVKDGQAQLDDNTQRLGSLERGTKEEVVQLRLELENMQHAREGETAELHKQLQDVERGVEAGLDRATASLAQLEASTDTALTSMQDREGEFNVELMQAEQLHAQQDQQLIGKALSKLDQLEGDQEKIEAQLWRRGGRVKAWHKTVEARLSKLAGRRFADWNHTVDGEPSSFADLTHDQALAVENQKLQKQLKQQKLINKELVHENHDLASEDEQMGQRIQTLEHEIRGLRPKPPDVGTDASNLKGMVEDAVKAALEKQQR